MSGPAVSGKLPNGSQLCVLLLNAFLGQLLPPGLPLLAEGACFLETTKVGTIEVAYTVGSW